MGVLKQLTATSMIGVIALAGIIVRNSILLVDFVQHQRRAEKPLAEAVTAAAAVRARPIHIDTGQGPARAEVNRIHKDDTVVIFQALSEALAKADRGRSACPALRRVQLGEDIILNFGYSLVAILVASTVASFYLGFTPLAASLILLIFSLITYGLYAKDKKAAQSGAWRVSERTLHIASLLSGWPGALIAQQRLRHKTRKASFRAAFWMTLLVNSAGLAWLHTPQGNAQLRNSLHRVENAAISHLRQETGLHAVLFLIKIRPQQRF